MAQKLKRNNKELSTDNAKFANFESVVERTSWVEKGSARVSLGPEGYRGASRWENCELELEQTGTVRGEVDFGTLSVFGTKRFKVGNYKKSLKNFSSSFLEQKFGLENE